MWKAGYFAVLILAALIRPLSLEETLQLAATTQSTMAGFWHSMAQAPGASPLEYLLQWASLAVLGHSVLASRFASLLFAVGASCLFFKLAGRIPLQQTKVALVLFALLPIHYQFATSGRPYEAALFLYLGATLCFFRLIESPGPTTSAAYGAALTACLYTEPSSYFPAAGYLLALFVFVKAAGIRKALWWALPATVTPAVLFAPYAFSVQGQANPRWLFGPDHYFLRSSAALRVLQDLSSPYWIGYALSALLIVGALVGIWRCFRLSASLDAKRVRLCVLFGGVISTAVLAAATDLASGSLFSASQIFWAVPGFVLLSGAAIDWLTQTRSRSFFAYSLGNAAVVLCLIGNVVVLSRGDTDLRPIIATLEPELTGDSCVVFTSQGVSKDMFVAFEPALASSECRHFLHHRIVLASHPYVTAGQQADAESFLRGLNFVEAKRNAIGGSEVLVFDQRN